MFTVTLTDDEVTELQQAIYHQVLRNRDNGLSDLTGSTDTLFKIKSKLIVARSRRSIRTTEEKLQAIAQIVNGA